MDRELAAALAGELPATAGLKISDATPPLAPCPDGVSGASYDLPDGRITVLLVNSDVTSPTLSHRTGVARATATTDDGRTVTVVSEPFTPGDPPPFGDDVQQVATDLARVY